MLISKKIRLDVSDQDAATKEHDPELRWVYGKLLHEVYFRLDGAMQAFFRRVKNGEKPGFPVRRIVGSY